MSNVSPAARELAKKIDDEWELVPDNGFHFGVDELEAAREKAIESVAQLIQSAVKELVPFGALNLPNEAPQGQF